MSAGDNGWLIDKSALTRLTASVDAAEWVNRANRGRIRISTVTRLEIGFSARTASELRADLTGPPLSLIPVEYLRPANEDRALEVQALLADRGQHRASSIADLLVASTAEMSNLTLHHLDKDFDLITA